MQKEKDWIKTLVFLINIKSAGWRNREKIYDDETDEIVLWRKMEVLVEMGWTGQERLPTGRPEISIFETLDQRQEKKRYSVGRTFIDICQWIQVDPGQTELEAGNPAQGRSLELDNLWGLSNLSHSMIWWNDTTWLRTFAN